MKTRELIDLLRKTDPSGRKFIRWDGAVVSAELSTEGPFAFVEDGKLHYTMNGYRVIIHSKSSGDIVCKDLAQWYAGTGGVDPLADREMLAEKLLTLFDFRDHESRVDRYKAGVIRLLDQWIEQKQKA